MADKVREERSEARERRRSLAAKPFEELDESATNGAESTLTPLAAAKGVAATAAAAAVAGAIAGAAKALRERGSAPADDRGQHEEDEEPREPEAEQQVQEDEPTGDEPESEPEDDDDEEEEPQTVPPAAETEAEAEQPADDEEEPTQAAEADQERDGAHGRSPGDATEVVTQARDYLKNLLGADAESVSGIEHSNGNWSVTLEVVEVRRIPESTDILSSYTAVLDDDGGIVSLTRGRRYRRSQVEEA